MRSKFAWSNYIKLASSLVSMLYLCSCYVPKDPGVLEYAYDIHGLDLYPNKTIYLAHNIWYVDPMNISALNYLTGNIIPFGSEVFLIKAGKGYVTFRIQGGYQEFRIINDRASSMLKDKEIFNQIFTQTGDPILELGNITSEKIKDMKKGIVSLGMTKEQVLMVYGPAPKHINQLSEITWVYLINSQLKTTHLVFKGNKISHIFEN